MKKGFLISIKVIVSLVLLTYLLRRTGFEQIGVAMRLLNPVAFVISVILLLLGIYLSARRWRLFLPYVVGSGKVTGLCFMGAFFNLCLPGVVGGDVIKAYYLSRYLKKDDVSDVPVKDLGTFTVNYACAGSVLVDRCMGLAILVVLVTVVYPLGFPYLQGTPATWVVPCFLLAFVIVILLIFRLKVGSSFLPIKRLHDYLAEWVIKGNVVCKGLIYSAAIQLLAITSVLIMGWGLSLKVSLFSYFVFVPLINILLMVPISISGIGLREGAFAFFFSTLGVPTEKAIALSFLWFASQVVASLPGLYVYVASTIRSNAAVRNNV